MIVDCGIVPQMVTLLGSQETELLVLMNALIH